jgi:hypothetical protein
MRLVSLAVFAALVCVAACGQQSRFTTPPAPTQSDPSSRALSDTRTLVDQGYKWLLLIPPERAYAADRSVIMGGPLATGPMGGGYSHGFVSTYSLTQIDPDAPLNRWRPLGAFESEEQCTNYKAQQLNQISDPAWVTAQARKSPTHLVDVSGTRDLFETARCVSAAELSGK